MEAFMSKKLALRAEALNCFDMLIFHNMVIEQNETDLIYISRNFTEASEIKNIVQYHIEQITFSHFMTLSFLTMLERLDDKGDWLEGYKPAIELATKCTISALLNRDTVDAQLATMAKHGAEQLKMNIISGKNNFQKNIPESIW